jgi:hypothetical protein
MVTSWWETIGKWADWLEKKVRNDDKSVSDRCEGGAAIYKKWNTPGVMASWDAWIDSIRCSFRLLPWHIQQVVCSPLRRTSLSYFFDSLVLARPGNEKKRMGSVVVLTFRPPRISGLDATMTDDNISKVLLLASLFRVKSKIRSTSVIRSSRRRLHLLALRRPDRSKVCVMYAFAYSYCRVSILRFVVETTPALLVSPRGRRQAFKVVCDAPLSSLRRCSVTQAHSGYP